MAVAVSTTAVSSGNTTTSCTVAIPSTNVPSGALLYLFVPNGGATTAPTVTDNEGAGSWAEKEFKTGTTFRGSMFWKRATVNTAGKTITVSGATDSCCAALIVITGGPDSGDGVHVILSELNASANETMAQITPTLNNCMVIIAIINDDNVAPTSMSCSNPAALAQRCTVLSSGGADSGVTVYGNLQTTAAATGAFNWAQTNCQGVSIAFAVAPGATVYQEGGALAVQSTAVAAATAGFQEAGTVSLASVLAGVALVTCLGAGALASQTALAGDEDFGYSEGATLALVSTLTVANTLTAQGTGNLSSQSALAGVEALVYPEAGVLAGVSALAVNAVLIFPETGLLALQSQFFVDETFTSGGGTIYNEGGLLAAQTQLVGDGWLYYPEVSVLVISTSLTGGEFVSYSGFGSLLALQSVLVGDETFSGSSPQTYNEGGLLAIQTQLIGTGLVSYSGTGSLIALQSVLVGDETFSGSDVVDHQGYILRRLSDISTSPKFQFATKRFTRRSFSRRPIL